MGNQQMDEARPSAPSRRPRRLTWGEMQDMCRAFNAEHAVGDTITVYTGLIGVNPKEVQIRYEAQILGGHTPVVYVTGAAAGCVALTHVAPSPPPAS